MAQLKIPVDDFALVCRFTCETTEVYKYPDESADEADFIDTQYGVKTAPTTNGKTVTFALDYPQGATITSAKVYATLGAPLYGAKTSTINGVSVGVNQTVSVDVEIADGAASVDVPFRFLCNTPSHAHDTGSSEWADSVSSSGLYEYHRWYFDHASSLNYTDVYLLIEYTPAIEFSGWTDDPLVIGETYVKAVHMTEIQQWTTVLSEYANNGTPTFTVAVPGETSLALWLSQVQEIRAVLDVISPDHEEWIDVSVNCPRADVMTQIREIIVAAM